MIATLIQRAVVQGIPLLFGSTGEIMTEKSGNLNLGIPGIMYVGGISGVIGAFLYENSLATPQDANGFLAISIPMLPTLLFCQISFEPISKGFHITILTQRVIFSSENISPMVPFVYRMAFDIGVVWEIQNPQH